MDSQIKHLQTHTNLCKNLDPVNFTHNQGVAGSSPAGPTPTRRSFTRRRAFTLALVWRQDFVAKVGNGPHLCKVFSEILTQGMSYVKKSWKSLQKGVSL